MGIPVERVGLLQRSCKKNGLVALKTVDQKLGKYAEAQDQV